MPDRLLVVANRLPLTVRRTGGRVGRRTAAAAAWWPRWDP